MTHYPEVSKLDIFFANLNFYLWAADDHLLSRQKLPFLENFRFEVFVVLSSVLCFAVALVMGQGFCLCVCSL